MTPEWRGGVLGMQSSKHPNTLAAAVELTWEVGELFLPRLGT